jgi:hypothetical protein
MDIKDEQDKLDNLKIEEYKKQPTINLADSINRSMMGDLRGLTKGDYLTRIISSIAVVIILYLVFR